MFVVFLSGALASLRLPSSSVLKCSYLGYPHGLEVVTSRPPSFSRPTPVRVLVVRTLLKRLTLAPIHVSHLKIRGAFVYPCPQVLQLQSAIPYEPMDVFSCLEP